MIEGNNVISLAKGFNTYLNEICHCCISWGGNNLDLPEILPPIKEKKYVESPY